MVSEQSLPPFITPAIDPRARNAGYALIGTAAVVLLATVTKAWFTAPGEGGLGLLGVEVCHRGACQSASWFDVPFVPAHVTMLATLALLASIATVARAGHTAVMLLRGTPEHIRLRWLGHATGIALVSVIGFVVSLALGDWTRGLSLGWSTIVGLAGLFATAITAAIVVPPLTRHP